MVVYSLFLHYFYARVFDVSSTKSIYFYGDIDLQNDRRSFYDHSITLPLRSHCSFLSKQYVFFLSTILSNILIFFKSFLLIIQRNIQF